MDGEEVSTGACGDTVAPNVIESTGNDVPGDSLDARPTNFRSRTARIFGGVQSRFERFWNRIKGSDEVFPSNELATTAKMPAEMDAEYYNFNHPKRGSAIIFNNEYFDVENLGRRLGTNVDRDNLRECLEFLGFEVTVHNDPTCKEIASTIQRVAVSDHSDCDCIVVAVLSHGKQGSLYAKDGTYKPHYLWEPFAADKCPSLAGKPKLFFIQVTLEACQGEMLDPGIILSRTQVDGHSDSYKIPTQADFLIVYSSVPGYYSFRNTKEGSWFIQSLCNELKTRGTKLDVQSLLTCVFQRVAFYYESKSEDPDFAQKKQMPVFHSRLTRRLQFNEKNGLGV